ncbi:hypothetical protein B0O99DRAFT_613406 [Bisporella sp. PMI_857]|nr:hypothetical protein B0O99DRAFT_613406 [Bisporella sp. PMI_857]
MQSFTPAQNGDALPHVNNLGIQPLERFLLANPTVQFLRFQWIDYAGVVMVRVVTKSYAISLVETNSQISLPSPILHCGLLDGSLIMEKFDVGEDRLWPDWSTLKACQYQPGHASLMCFIEEGGHRDGKGFRRCPRSCLRELETAAKTMRNLEFLIGVEMEFQIMKPAHGSQPAQPVQTTSYPYSAASLRNEYLPFLDEIVGAFVKAGIKIRQYHSEGSSGMFEITGEPLPPLEAMDTLVFCHETIKGICSNRGLQATFHPKPTEKQSPVGSHIHVSISRVDKEDSFLAGLLQSWTGLAAFYMPNYDSYLRVKDDEWVSWSLGNRTAPIRKIKTGHWELRTPDGTMNPYLALLAILTAGLLGFESNLPLKTKDHKRILFINPLSEKDATEYGITDKMPSSLKIALAKLREDKALLESLGPEISERYLHVKTLEEAKFGKMTAGERREVSMRVF